MDITPDSLMPVMGRLRQAHREILAPMPQGQVVQALVELAARWHDPEYFLRRQAELLQEPFPFAMVRVSLDALLNSLAMESLWRLIDTEAVRDAAGFPLVGHVIAGNTPLLAWVSVIRALLVRSASLVKLPSGPAAEWGRLFHESLADVSPELAECVVTAHWPGGTVALDAILCRDSDLLMGYGSDETLHALQALRPAGLPFVGYGHRVSFGVVAKNGANSEAAGGFAKDILLYDQGGCLSPQTIFVEGGAGASDDFADLLATALAKTTAEFPLPVRAARAAMIVREARLLAQMEPGNRVREGPTLRWTVIARPNRTFFPSPAFGVVSVQPLDTLANLPEALDLVAGVLQGCAVAGDPEGYLPGVSRLCAPGELQTPALDWRQDGRDVLRLLIAPMAAR